MQQWREGVKTKVIEEEDEEEEERRGERGRDVLYPILSVSQLSRVTPHMVVVAAVVVVVVVVLVVVIDKRMERVGLGISSCHVMSLHIYCPYLSPP